jgi:c-di-GMP-related signal transduction protein
VERVRKLFGFLQNPSDRMIKICESLKFAVLLLSIDNIFELKRFVKHYLFSECFSDINMLLINRPIFRIHIGFVLHVATSYDQSSEPLEGLVERFEWQVFH